MAAAFQQQIDFKTDAASPQLVYRLATPVPANWTPLLPVRPLPLDLANPLAIRLERAGMKRFYPEASVEMLDASDPEAQIPVCAQERRQELALDRSQQERGPRRSG